MNPSPDTGNPNPASIMSFLPAVGMTFRAGEMGKKFRFNQHWQFSLCNPVPHVRDYNLIIL